MPPIPPNLTADQIFAAHVTVDARLRQLKDFTNHELHTIAADPDCQLEVRTAADRLVHSRARFAKASISMRERHRAARAGRWFMHQASAYAAQSSES